MSSLPARLLPAPRAFVASLLACLLLIQIAGFLPFPSATPIEAGASALSAAQDICATGRGDADPAPAPAHHGGHHCALCAMGEAFDANCLAIVATLIAPERPRALSGNFQSGRHDDEGSPPGWASAWSSQAPPGRV